MEETTTNCNNKSIDTKQANHLLAQPVVINNSNGRRGGSLFEFQMHVLGLLRQGDGQYGPLETRRLERTQ